MKFAKLVFYVAGIWGLLVLVPHYFLENYIGQETPPRITHPEYFYGFVGVGIAWQLAFLLIATDPVRYRLIMLAGIAEKWLFVSSSVTLLLMGSVAHRFAVPVAIDFILGVFFLVAYIKTGKSDTPAV
jgi:hypothetical protein